VTVLALVLMLLAAAAPLTDRPLRGVVADPVVPVALLAGVLLAAAAVVAARTADPVSGTARAGALVLGVVVAVTAGSHVVRAVFRLTRKEFWPGRPDRTGHLGAAHEASESRTPRVDASGEPPLHLETAGSVLRGGAWIGYLERGAVAATLLAGFPEGLALVLAVKGVGRYPELRDAGRGADAPEEFIIGTLASLLWAAAAAGTATLLA
jgi:hypothetical protein